jgi:uncharacterized membrane protein
MDIIHHAQEEEYLSEVSMGQEALFHATCAAELYMKAVAEITTAQERSRLRARFEKVFAIAERWKNHNYASLDGQRNADFDGLCGQTLSISPCSLHGVDFPPWRQPEGSMFCLPPGETQYAYVQSLRSTICDSLLASYHTMIALYLYSCSD